MKRTTVMLPDALKLRASRKASEVGISLGELIRQSLASVVRDKKSGSHHSDPLFSDLRTYTGKAPKDLAGEHDRYLYGEEA